MWLENDMTNTTNRFNRDKLIEAGDDIVFVNQANIEPGMTFSSKIAADAVLDGTVAPWVDDESDDELDETTAAMLGAFMSDGPWWT
jgi:hypothetical protein